MVIGNREKVKDLGIFCKGRRIHSCTGIHHSLRWVPLFAVVL